MEKDKTKRNALYAIYFGLFLILMGLLYYADYSSRKMSVTPKEDNDYTYVSRLFDDGVKRVVSTPKVIIRPYSNAEVKVLKGYYDYKADEKTQENSIINYESTYIQNSGVIFGGVDEQFEVRSILDGKVTSVKDDKLMGKIVTIEHENKITTTYQSLSEVTVKENDQISQGTVIGKAGESNFEKDLGNHLLFEITLDGKYINPESVFDKQVTDIK
ncbi:MAG: M23 family metallopeptidase [Bacilli bacterium]|nr:M23 family metallopeptidase [Bacilli bacterium]